MSDSLMPSCGLLLALIASAVAPGSAAAAPIEAPAAFAPNESEVTPQADLIDPEFSQSRARIAWVDRLGSLRVASVDRTTGLLKPSNGKGVRVDRDAMMTADLKTVFNGPEWLTTTGSDQIVYTKFLAGKRHTIENGRLAIAAQSSTGAWSFRYLSDLPRNGPYASTDPVDPAPRITYIDPDGNHYWREVSNPVSETLVPWFPASFFISMRFVRGARATVFRSDTNGSQQVFRYWLDSQLLEQLTLDTGHDNSRSAPWMWQAPEFGNDYVLSVLANEDRELRIYRQVDKTKPIWQIVHRAAHPDGGVLTSAEPFTHNGRSWVFMTVAAPPNDFPSAVLLSNILASEPVLRQLTPDLPVRARKDPEVFVTTTGPFLYFNRADPNCTAPDQPPPNWLECSEGLFRTDTGLGQAVAAD